MSRTDTARGPAALRTALRALATATVALGLLLGLQPAQADELAELFRRGTHALARGEYEQAIDQLEGYADRGGLHPDASYNRGLAYVMRVRAEADRPGDLGRAAAAFEETRLLRPGDPDAEHALELVHAQVARRRARRGMEVVNARPTLDRVAVGLASERTWGIGAALASLLLAAGLVLRARPRGPAQVAGKLLAPSALLALLLLGLAYHQARDLRLSTRAAVLVTREAHLTDEKGAVLGGEAVPEAAKLEVGQRRGRLVHVRWGSREGWLPASSVRVLRRP